MTVNIFVYLLISVFASMEYLGTSPPSPLLNKERGKIWTPVEELEKYVFDSPLLIKERVKIWTPISLTRRGDGGEVLISYEIHF